MAFTGPAKIAAPPPNGANDALDGGMSMFIKEQGAARLAFLTDSAFSLSPILTRLDGNSSEDIQIL